jgi:hypothetical protein
MRWMTQEMGEYLERMYQLCPAQEPNLECLAPGGPGYKGGWHSHERPVLQQGGGVSDG